ncbi:MAG TPA: hypothetical protein VHE30_03215 [Polyangiaceae bacterium]|nr:hypothetical protein [Polyangiaceae bacterium]
MSAIRLMLLVLSCLVLHASRAAAEPSSAAPTTACPDGDLLAGARALDAAFPPGRLALLGDGVVARDGAPWPDPSVLLTLDRPLTLELAQPAEVGQALLQVDADQALDIDLSADGNRWSRIPAPALDVASGMQLRGFDFDRTPTRYVRLTARTPGALAVSEFRLYCRHQAGSRRALVVRGDQAVAWAPGPVERALRVVTGDVALSPRSIDLVKASLVALTLAWMAAAWIVRRAGHGTSAALARAGRLVLGGLATVSVVAYFNFGAYRYPAFIHDHDVFHYFVGAKYFPEIGYNELYRCAAVAEAEAGFRERVLLRSQRDLRDNRLVTGAEVLLHPEVCKRHFSPERWSSFTRDVAYFADHRTVPDWNRILRDHGFNATPTWIVLGAAVARAFPANDETIGHVPAIFHGVVGPLDPILLAGALGAVLWAFGFRTACIVAIVFGANPLSEFSWVGGAFLRQAWLAALVIGICLLRRRYFRTGGAAIAVAGLLQLFPIVCLGSVALAGALGWLKTRRIDRDALCVLGAAAVTLALAVPASAWGSGRAGAWSEFTANTRKHAETPSGNYIGLRTALSFRPSTRIEVLFDRDAVDPFARAQAARLRNFGEMRPAYVLGIALGLWLLVRACRSERPWWWISVLGLPFTAIVLETSCYYAAWLAALALAGAESRRTEIVNLTMLLGLLAVELLELQIDVHYALASVVLVLGMAGVLLFAARTRSAGPTSEASREGPAGPLTPIA